MILRGEEAVLDRKLPHGDLQNLEVSYLFDHRRRFMIVATAGVFVCRVHVRSFLPLSIAINLQRAQASDPETRSATYRCRTGIPPRDPSAGTGRCNIVPAGHPG